jgi:hypothetical protein
MEYMITTASKITQKLKSLPANLLEQVDNYIDFLAYKSNLDWGTSLSKKQIEIIEKGRKDILEGNVMSHTEAKAIIKKHIKSKIA